MIPHKLHIIAIIVKHLFTFVFEDAKELPLLLFFLFFVDLVVIILVEGCIVFDLI